MYQRHRDNLSNSNPISIAISNTPSSTGTTLYNNNINPSSKTMASRQWKQFQREFYSFIFSTLGKSIILVGIIFGFYFILSIIAMWSTYMTGENVITKTMSISSISPFCTHCSQRDYKDNLKDMNMEDVMCYEPMDVVYTWVNGNDPQLQSDIETYKRQHEIEEHLKKDPNWTQPIGIKFNVVLHGGTRKKWKGDFAHIIKDELSAQIKVIINDYKELIVKRPNKTVHQSNGSIDDIIQNIAALGALDEIVMDNEKDTEEYVIDDEKRRLLSMDENDVAYDHKNRTEKTQIKDDDDLEELNDDDADVNNEDEDMFDDDDEEQYADDLDKADDVDPQDEYDGSNVTNVTNTTNTNTTSTEAPFVLPTFWQNIKLRLVRDYDVSNAFCYNEEELRQILWIRNHPPNITNTTINATITNTTLSNKKSKLLDIEQDIALMMNDTNNTTNTTTSTTSKAPDVNYNPMNRSYCIELQIELIHKDEFAANQTWPFIQILQNNKTFWNNFTQNVNRKFKDADYNNYDEAIKPKKIHSLFDFTRFTLYSNQTLNMTLINVSEVVTGGKGRYRDNEELRYSLRSVWQFAPWVRNIYIVTNGQVPSWLNLDNDKIWIVTHEEIFANKSHLPTFASPSIEANIHRIPGLSRRFLYLNDDVMFGRNIYPDDFWKLDGTQYFYPSWEPPKCSEGCPNNWLNDGYCDSACNNEDCDWDSGDCLDANGTNTGSSSGGSGSKDGQKTENRYCTSGCPITWVGDKVCDRACQHVDCAYDGGDCGLKMMKENDVFGIELDPQTANGSVFELERDIMAFYIDFGQIFKRKQEEDKEDTTANTTETITAYAPTPSPSPSPTMDPDENKVKTAQHDHKDMIRTAIITQSEKILAVILHPHDRIDEEEEVVFDIGGVLNGEEIHYVFTIHRDAPEKKLNIDSVGRRMDAILGDMNATRIQSIMVKEVDPKSKTMEHRYEWSNDTVNAMQNLWKRIESETEKEKDKTSKLKGAMYDKLSELAGNNTKWMIESEDRLNDTMMSEYVMWMKRDKEEEKDVKKDGVQPTLPSYLFDEEFMYKYDDFFVGGERDEEGADTYDEYSNYYDDYNTDAMNKRMLLAMKTQHEEQRLDDDEDYHVMMQLGLIDAMGHWIPSKAARDWQFLTDFREDVLYENDEFDEAYDMIHVDGYIDGNALVLDDATRNAELRAMKQESMLQLDGKDLSRIRKKLDIIFDDNAMDMLPWMMNDLSLYVFYSKNKKTKSGRRLLDTFGESLRFVTRVLNKHFGVDTRYVPAHMAHAIDREILIELVDRFSDEYSSTSSHRFRSGHDMQWSFSYFYYMMSATYNLSSIDLIYSEWLDVNHDGILNDYELERMIDDILIGEAQKDSNDKMRGANDTIWKDFFHKAIWNITRQLHDLTYWHPLQITVYSVNYTQIIRDYLLKHFNKVNKFGFAKRDLNDVEFYMIKDAPNEVRDRLKHLYSKKAKFMCLNDDLPHDTDPSNETLMELNSFLTRFYPEASPFEIVDFNEYHQYLRKEEMMDTGYWKQKWNLKNNKHYKVYNDRFETKIALKNNLYKKFKTKQYSQKSDNYKSYYKRYKSYGHMNHSYHIDNDMPLPGEAAAKKEQIRTVFYSTIVRRFRQYHWLVQFIALFVFCSIVVTVFLKIVDIIWYYLTISASFLFTNNPRCFACCQWISFKAWFGTSDNQHND